MHRILDGKPEGKSPFGRPRRSWDDNIGMNPRELGSEGVAQERD